jgi:starch-binding outer membrane protein, SusD/RagB family
MIQRTRGFDVPDNFLLWLIPDSEIYYNKAIDPTKDQNPGN